MWILCFGMIYSYIYPLPIKIFILNDNGYMLKRKIAEIITKNKAMSIGILVNRDRR